MPILRVLTWNVLYGGAGREELIGAVLRELHPDIAVFTEAQPTVSFDAVADVVGPYRARSGSSGDRECVLIASRWPITRSQPLGPYWARLKWVVATTQPPSGPAMTIVGVHLCPQLLWPFELVRYHEVGALLRHFAKERPHLVADDFNALSTGDVHQLRRAPSWVRAQLIAQAGWAPRWALTRLLNAGYIDCYRARNPDDDGFTAPAWDPQARIDYVFTSREFAPALRSCGVPSRSDPRPAPRRSFAELLGHTPVHSLNAEASDHLPVWADFELPDTSP